MCQIKIFEQSLAKFDKLFYNFCMKKHLPFIFAFAFLVAFSFAWPKICGKVATNSFASNNIINGSAKTETTTKQTANEKLEASANDFYAELSMLNSFGEFAAFQAEGKFRIELLASSDKNYIIETAELFGNAAASVKTFRENNPSELVYNKLIEDDETAALLNNLYVHILTICGLD